MSRKRFVVRSPSEQLKHEAERVAVLLSQTGRFTKAFVARPNSGVGSNRSVVMMAPRSGVWQQALKCWGEDHRLRAETYAQLINQKAADDLHRFTDGQQQGHC